jgi:CheY-like chemotaxis protein
VEYEELSRIEHGTGRVRLRSIVGLSEVLHVTVGRLLARTQAAEEDPHGTGAAQAAVATGDILMVEDNRLDVELTVRAFRRAGISNPLVVAGDAEQAMDYLFARGSYSGRRPVHPQMILLDLNLPGMSGIEFLRRVKGYPSTLHIPVVVLTSAKGDASIGECGRLGAESYIVKPLSGGSVVLATPNLTQRVLQSDEFR